MKTYIVAIAALVLLTEAVTAQSIHPTTREGFGAKPDSAESQSERIPEPPGANRPEAQGRAESQLNRDYGKETQPEGKELSESSPPDLKP